MLRVMVSWINQILRIKGFQIRLKGIQRWIGHLSYENEFCMQFHSHANQSHFHRNGFALRLALKHIGTGELGNGLLSTFWYQICRGLKNFAFDLMPGKFGKFGLKVLFVSCTFIVRVAEALEAWMKISVDVAMMINQCSLWKSTSKAQVFNTVKFPIVNNYILFLYLFWFI